jgi:hypothetical protein
VCETRDRSRVAVIDQAERRHDRAVIEKWRQHHHAAIASPAAYRAMPGAALQRDERGHGERGVVDWLRGNWNIACIEVLQDRRFKGSMCWCHDLPDRAYVDAPNPMIPATELAGCPEMLVMMDVAESVGI